jgi:transcriptional regulator with XRE-family HTH domain
MYVAMYGERVRELREEKVMSKRGLAAAAGITPKTARRAEREGPVTMWTARKVATALGVGSPQGLARPLSSRA